MADETTSRSTFRDIGAQTQRIAETGGNITSASFANGMNNAGCSAGAGVGFAFTDSDGNEHNINLTGSPEQFTLLDQMNPAGAGNPRTPQISQLIGGVAFEGGTPGPGVEFLVGVVNPSNDAKAANPELDGSVAENGTADLLDLAGGWIPS
jgi:hypothetical protein